MNWRNFWNRLRGKPAALETDLDEEIAFHFEMKERALRAQGLSGEQIDRAARASLGNLTQFREESREAWSFRWLDDFRRDLVYGFRALRAQPGFVLGAVLALTLGIGVNAVLFSVYNALALAPWAVRDAANSVQILTERGRVGRWSGFSWPEYRYLRANSKTFDGIAAFDSTGIRVTRGEETWSGAAMSASDNYFEVLGTGFALGRGFSPEAGDIRHPAPEIVLHYDTWVTRFGGDASAVGQWLDLNGQKLQIVGVAAQGFSGPNPGVPLMWIPAPWREIMQPGLNLINEPGSCCAHLAGHLRPNVGRASGQAELNTLSNQFRESVKQPPTRVLLTGLAFLANPTDHQRASSVFLVVGIATILILLLACANVANLQLARCFARRREIAVRLSLGAGRGRLLRQLLVEGLLLSSLSGLATVFIARFLPEWVLRQIAAGEGSFGFQFDTDWRVISFIAGVTALAALLFGLAPALATIGGVSAGLREGGRATSQGRLRTVLLAFQIALCVVLLSGSALLFRAMSRAAAIEPGFQPANALVLRPNLESSGVDDRQAQDLLQPLLERLRTLPGVESVAHTSVLPLGNSFNNTSFRDPRTGQDVRAASLDVSAGFFGTLRAPMAVGREFSAAEEGREDIVVINEALAHRLWPGEHPLGKILPDSTRQVIGVVRDFSIREISPGAEFAFFRPSKGTRISSILIRHSGPDEALRNGLPKMVRETDRRFMPAVAPYTETTARFRRAAATAASVASAMSALALLLACVGIYGVAAYDVNQRIREIGVRMALGALPSAILRSVLRRNLQAVAAGAVLGIAGAIGVARLLTGMLYGLPPGDPVSFIAAVGILAITSVIASFSPARRATRVDPATALRYE